MRILLDEQLPRQLAPYLVGHDVRTVQQESWAGLSNGALLRKAEAAGFSVFLTGDHSLEFQQNISKQRMGIVVLRAGSNALEDLLPIVPAARWSRALFRAVVCSMNPSAAATTVCKGSRRGHTPDLRRLGVSD